MKVQRFPLGLVFVLTIGFGTWLATSSPAQETESPAKSEALTKKLIDRINVLEARVAELEQKKQRLPMPVLAKPLQPSDFSKGLTVQQPRQVPRSWGRNEINGMEYFIVSLQGGAASFGE